MAWRTIDTADIEAHLNAGELDEYRQHAAQIEDPLPVLIDDVTNLVRGFVGTRYALEGPGVPDELRAPSIDLVIHRLAKRVLKAGEADADRRAAAEAAARLLQLVAEGKFAVAPEEEATILPSAGSWGSDPKFRSPPFPEEDEA